MLHFEYDNDPAAPNFDLSHNALEPIHGGLSGYAKSHGRVAHFRDMYPVIPGGDRPVGYVASIDPRVVKGIFHSDDDTMTAEDACDITYSEPHLLYPTGEGHNGDIVREDITVVLKWKFDDSALGLNEYYTISKHDGVISAFITPEYFGADGKRISPNNLEPGRWLSDEAIIDTINDLFALERPLTLDDSEKLHELIEVLNG